MQWLVIVTVDSLVGFGCSKTVEKGEEDEEKPEQLGAFSYLLIKISRQHSGIRKRADPPDYRLLSSAASIYIYC